MSAALPPDKVRVAVGAEERTNQRLRVEVAELEAPAHVIGAANEIGLVSAERVDYTPLAPLAPLDAGSPSK